MWLLSPFNCFYNQGLSPEQGGKVAWANRKKFGSLHSAAAHSSGANGGIFWPWQVWCESCQWQRRQLSMSKHQTQTPAPPQLQKTEYTNTGVWIINTHATPAALCLQRHAPRKQCWCVGESLAPLRWNEWIRYTGTSMFSAVLWVLLLLGGWAFALMTWASEVTEEASNVIPHSPSFQPNRQNFFFLLFDNKALFVTQAAIKCSQSQKCIADLLNMPTYLQSFRSELSLWSLVL